jgi:hypothetical protein
VSARGVLLTATFLTSAVAVISLRVVLAGEAAIERGTAALEAGDVDTAIAESEVAASWYAPGAPHVRVAYARLEAIAVEAERRRQRGVALSAYRAVVASSESTRWLLTPHAADAQRAREAIARLESTGPRPPATADEPAAAIEAAQLRALSRAQGPRHRVSVVLAASFVAAVAGLVLTLRRAVDETGRLDASRARWPLAIAALGLLGYLVALWVA